jgi:hypothetical protein
MLVLCPHCAQNCADSCIPEFQRLAFESADFQMSPSDVDIKLNILLANLKF